MANYQQNPMFGQSDGGDGSLPVTWDAYGGGYSTDPSAVPVTSGPESSGMGVNWTAIGTTLINAGASVAQAALASDQPVGAQPIYQQPTYVPPSGTIAAAGSINSTVLLAGAAALLFILMKK